MNASSILFLLATVAALVLLPVSLELSVSVALATGLLALLAKDYGRNLAPLSLNA